METVIIVITTIIVLLIVFLWLVFPNKKRTIPISTSYAHRGLHGGQIPENSLPAFKLASENGYGVEFDIQLTRDKKIVVFHDNSLLRMGNVDALISDLTYEELCKYGIGDTNERIPLLKEVLSTLAGVPVLCEIKPQKSSTNTEICSYLVSELDDYPGDICVESFSPFIVKWFKVNRPDFARGQLSANFIKSKDELQGFSAFLMTNMLLNFLSRPDFIAYRFTDFSVGLNFCKKVLHCHLLGWTPVGDKEREQCRANFDGEIFELDIDESADYFKK